MFIWNRSPLLLISLPPPITVPHGLFSSVSPTTNINFSLSSLNSVTLFVYSFGNFYIYPLFYFFHIYDTQVSLPCVTKGLSLPHLKHPLFPTTFFSRLFFRFLPFFSPIFNRHHSFHFLRSFSFANCL